MQSHLSHHPLPPRQRNRPEEHPRYGLPKQHGGHLGAVLPTGLAVVDRHKVSQDVAGVQHQQALPYHPEIV